MSEMCIFPCRLSCEHYRHGEPEGRGHPGFLNTWITTQLTFPVMTTNADNMRLLSQNHVKKHIAKECA